MKEFNEYLNELNDIVNSFGEYKGEIKNADCEYFKVNRGFNCYKGHNCTDKECSDCYYKQLKRLQQDYVNLGKAFEHLKSSYQDNCEYVLQLETENVRKKDMIERQWKLLEQCGVSASGELKRVSYLLEKLRDENKQLKEILE